ncbi:MAG: secondary thiamine-phosphate synthase enzyme YjbQ [Candidatus Bathyarchaeia archaeon]
MGRGRRALAVFCGEIAVESKGEADILDITGEVDGVIRGSGIRNGIATISVIGATGAVTTMEYEPGLLKDFPAMLERIAPKGIPYEHEKRWRDRNGHSHVRASLLGPSITLPVRDGSLLLGTWQQVVFIELDIRARKRRLAVHVMGE